MSGLLKTVGDVSANEKVWILASNYQHQSLAISAGIVGNVWKEFENTPDWTYPSTSSLIDDTLGKVSAGKTFQQGSLRYQNTSVCKTSVHPKVSKCLSSVIA